MSEKYFLTSYAKLRMTERKISKVLLEDALSRPTKIMYDEKGKIMIKKLYIKAGRTRLLLVVTEVILNKFKIITIIDTSKVKKYL